MESQQHESEMAHPGYKVGKCESMCPVLVRLTPADIARHTARIKPDRGGKGRTKVKIELVKNKARRYATFSKRKIGMMKKAHELAMLTGSQVLLVVVSETGHMYTNATCKLQPLLTGKEGKALIQTCLSSPDPPSHYDPTRDERISPRGYEETDKALQLSSGRAAGGRCTEASASLLDTTPNRSGAQSTEATAPSSTIPPRDFSYVPTGTDVMYNNYVWNTVLYPSSTTGAVWNTVLYPSSTTGADEGCMNTVLYPSSTTGADEGWNTVLYPSSTTGADEGCMNTVLYPSSTTGADEGCMNTVLYPSSTTGADEGWNTVLYPSSTTGADEGCMHNGQWIPMVPQCSS